MITGLPNYKIKCYVRTTLRFQNRFRIKFHQNVSIIFSIWIILCTSPVLNQQQQTPANSNHQTGVMNSQSSSTVSPSALLEQRRLFNFGKRQSSSSGSKPKSSKKKKELTHTLKFVCLSSKNAVKPPTTVKERTQGQKASPLLKMNLSTIQFWIITPNWQKWEGLIFYFINEVVEVMVVSI